MIVLEVLGTPAPKGSSRAFVNKRTGRAIVAPSGSAANKDRLANWSSATRDEARRIIGEREVPPFVDRPLVVAITFRIARTAGHWGKGKNAGRLMPSAPKFPRGKPDIDKLARTTLDALTGIVFDDDSRIVKLELAKLYANPGNEGAMITIGEVTT